jgi:hypothetical protein
MQTFSIKPDLTQNDNCDSDAYGFFCDLEAQEDRVEFYVISKTTHYEVRRKSDNRPKINGVQRTNIINLSSAKSSTEELEFIAESSKRERSKRAMLSFVVDFPRRACHSLFMCCATMSCVYFILTLPDNKQ